MQLNHFLIGQCKRAFLLRREVQREQTDGRIEHFWLFLGDKAKQLFTPSEVGFCVEGEHALVDESSQSPQELDWVEEVADLVQGSLFLISPKADLAQGDFWTT